MASKKRGGLSKREYAAAQLKVPKVQSKVVKPRASTKVSTPAGAIGQNRDGSYIYGQNYTPANQSSVLAGPSLPGKVAPGFYDYSKNKAVPPTQATTRELAARAKQKKSSSGLNYTPAPPKPSVSGLNYTPAPPKPSVRVSNDSILPDDNSFNDRLISSLKNMAVGAIGNVRKIGDIVHTPDLGITESLGVNKWLKNNTYAIPTANASNRELSALEKSLQKEPDIPTGYGDNGEIFYNENDRMSPLSSDFAPPGTNFSRPGSEDAYNQGENPILYGNRQRNNQPELNYTPRGKVKGAGTNTPYQIPDELNYTSAFSNPAYSSVNDTADSSQKRYEDLYGALREQVAPSQEEISQYQNEQYGGEPISDTPSGTIGNRSGRGSGLFGTGKGVGNPAGDDQYIKELRKAYASNGGEKWLRQQFDELIKALDPTYDQYRKEGTDALNAQLRNQNLQLASVMNANNTGDSEQRAQLMAGQQRDTTTALGNLLAKLAMNKQQDISGYKSEQAKQMGQLQDRNQTNRQRLMEQIQQYRQQQYSNRFNESEAYRKSRGSKSYGTAIDNIMATQGVDATTARKIYDKQNNLSGGQPIATGSYEVDPDDGVTKQVFIVNGVPGFLY